MTPSSRRLSILLAAAALGAALACETPPGPSPSPEPGAGTPVPAPAQRIRPADQTPLPDTDENVEHDQVQAARGARDGRATAKASGFEAFEQSVYRDPDGKYIVSGDVAISDPKQLHEFYETSVATEPPALSPGSLVVHSPGGQDAIWNTTEKKQLTYCVSTTFGSRHAVVVQQMDAATRAWEQIADLDFIHTTSQDGSCTAQNPNVVFDVRPVNVNGQYLARAFFPKEPRTARNVLIDESALSLPAGNLQLVGILRHELGHTLGWRHEHTRPESGTCFEDNDFRPLTSYDRFSVMHYPQCNGGGDWSLELTARDKNGAACLYGAASGFTVDPSLCLNPPTAPSAGCAPKTETFTAQQIASGQQKSYPAFAAKAGSRFETKMTGSGASPGDPDLYVRFGSAPSTTTFACRPYLSGAEEACALDVPAGQSQAFVMVRGYTAGRYQLTVTHTP